MRAMLAVALVLWLVGGSEGIGEGLDVDSMLKAFVSMGSIFTGDVETVDVNNALLMGKWHQMYKSAMNFDVFRSNMYCEVAYFRANSVMERRGGFEILEAYRVTDKTGNVEVYKHDIAREPKPFGADAPRPGRFWMHTQEYFYPQEFNIVKLGLETENDTEAVNGTRVVGYSYVVVTDSRRTKLLLFARDPADFRARHKDEVLDYFRQQCFGNGCFWNQAEAVYQEADCIYPTEKEVRVRRALKNHLSRSGQAQQPASFLQSLGGAGGLGRAFGQAALAQPSNDRRPSVQLSPQQTGAFGAFDPVQAIQGLVSNLGFLGAAGKKK